MTEQLEQTSDTDLDVYNLEMYYCEYCGQLWPSNDLFYTHRSASEHDKVREIGPVTGFAGKTEVKPGEAVMSARIGSEPCTAEFLEEEQ